MGIYQLCYLKMHSGMLFLAGHTEDKEKETLLKALSDVMDAARKAMAGKSFARSPYRAPIAALAAGAAAALAYLEQGIDTVLTNAYCVVASAVEAHAPAKSE